MKRSWTIHFSHVIRFGDAKIEKRNAKCLKRIKTRILLFARKINENDTLSRVNLCKSRNYNLLYIPMDSVIASVSLKTKKQKKKEDLINVNSFYTLSSPDVFHKHREIRIKHDKTSPEKREGGWKNYSNSVKNFV